MLRVDQLLARFGYCSRREAVAWVRDGRVSCAGVIQTDPARRISVAETLVDDEPVEFPEGLLIALNKPLGCVCSHDEGEGPSVYDLLPEQWMHRNPAPTTVGRLDKDTSGLILITDQGPLVHRWTSPKRHVEKVYAVTTESPIPPETVALFASGTLLLHQEKSPCQPAQLEILTPLTAHITLTEGRYHQVRRMFASQGCPVVDLQRIRFGKLTLEGLPEGEWRPISVEDVC
jgi:16S rRNA pseudouridine516 synthase